MYSCTVLHNVSTYTQAPPTVNADKLIIPQVEDPQVVLCPGAKLGNLTKLVEAQVERLHAINGLRKRDYTIIITKLHPAETLLVLYLVTDLRANQVRSFSKLCFIH